MRPAAPCRAALLRLSCLTPGVAPARDSGGTTAAQQQQAGTGLITPSSVLIVTARQNGLFCTTRTGLPEPPPSSTTSTCAPGTGTRSGHLTPAATTTHAIGDAAARVARRTAQAAPHRTQALLREMRETAYQFRAPFIVDCSKFAAAFGRFDPTPHRTAVEKTVKWYRSYRSSGSPP